jgi:hypothetical protein
MALAVAVSQISIESSLRRHTKAAGTTKCAREILSSDLSLLNGSIALAVHSSSPYFVSLGIICGTVSQVSTCSSLHFMEHLLKAHCHC